MMREASLIPTSRARRLQLLGRDAKGFSVYNLRYMRDLAKVWPVLEIWQQAAAKLPWGHNMVLVDRLGTAEDRLVYAQEQAIEQAC